MKLIFDNPDEVDYGDIKIRVRWKRCELKRKMIIEKDYISFTYKNFEVSDSYISDEYDMGARVRMLCGLIDAGNFEALNDMKVELNRIKNE